MGSAEKSNDRESNNYAPTRPTFNKHNDGNINKKFKCNKCNYEDESETKIKEHMANIHILDEKFQCRKCEYEGYTREDLSHHMADEHDIDIRRKNGSQRYFSGKRIDMKKSQNGGFVRKQNEEICFYWNHGYCRFGDECYKSHKESPYCHFQENCFRKSMCKFFHEDSGQQHFLEKETNQGFYR